VHDPEAYRAESRRGWGSVAAAWGRHADHVRSSMEVTTWLVDAAHLQPGSAVLELAAGTGEVGFFAYELVQPGGSLICSDFTPEMLTEAQRRAEELGFHDVRFKQIDAESIDLEAASLDAVLCRWGFMLMADPGAALRECRRVLRPGGRLALAAWGAAEDNPWSSVVGQVLRPRGLMAEVPPGTPHQFAWAREGLIREELEAAGFVDDIEVESVSFTYRDTFDRWWERTLDMARSAQAILGLPADEREAVRSELRERLSRYEGDDGVLALPARSWVAAASA
jgi:SAM-dependent methyltransferase